MYILKVDVQTRAQDKHFRGSISVFYYAVHQRKPFAVPAE